MAPEAARALDQKVDRSEIGNDQVKIEIEGLFNHLRCDENARPYNLRRTAKFFQHPFLDPQPIGHGEARMKQ